MFSSVISNPGAPELFESAEEEVALFRLLLEVDLIPSEAFLLEALPVESDNRPDLVFMIDKRRLESCE